ncbi:MAG: hypothetical protein RLZZ29_281 [Cyanobacteriota bacterium]|jgi:hypothetical protein
MGFWLRNSQFNNNSHRESAQWKKDIFLGNHPGNEHLDQNPLLKITINQTMGWGDNPLTEIFFVNTKNLTRTQPP